MLYREDEDPEVARTSEDVVQDALSKLTLYTKIDLDYKAPPPRTFSDDIRDARSIRDYMDAHNKTAVCSCCSRRRGRDDVQWCPLSKILNIELLSTQGLKTPEFPRDGLTQFRNLCLQVQLFFYTFESGSWVGV